MKKKYQVFVSSTYQDLIEERKEIIQALLELDCIPSGMELFPAANEDQWSLIKKVIDDCDYYIVVIAGRYGSVDIEGISFTEKEYRYALEQSKPIMGFIHNAPDQISVGQSDTEPEKKQKLEDFKGLVKQKMVKLWSTPAELGSVVSRSLVQTINNHPAVGWIRADNLPTESASQEILKLRNEIDRLQKSIKENQRSAPPGTEALSQGRDKFEIRYYVTASIRGNVFHSKAGEWEGCNASWNVIFASVSPLLIDEASTEDIKTKLQSFIRVNQFDEIEKWLDDNSSAGEKHVFKSLTISENSFETVLVQLRALGLIDKNQKARSVKDKKAYWTLTPYGDATMTLLRAVKKSTDDEES